MSEPTLVDLEREAVHYTADESFNALTDLIACVRELRAALADATGQLARLDPRLVGLAWYEDVLARYPEEPDRA